MAIARIVTSSPEQVELIVEKLRGSGYEVEVVSPGSVQADQIPDLEMHVEPVAIEHALQRASEISDAAGKIPVFIAAGTYRAPLQSTNSQAEGPDEPEPQAKDHSETVPSDSSVLLAEELQNKRNLLAKALREQRARTLDQRRRERAQRFEEAERIRAAERNAETARQLEAIHLAELERERRAAFSEQVEPLAAGETADAQQFSFDSGTLHSGTVEAGLSVRHESQHEARRRGVAHKRESHLTRAGRRGRAREWRAAIVISGIFAVILAIAWAMTSREPESPIPTSMFEQQQRMEQQVPFGPVKLDSGNKSETNSAPNDRSGPKLISDTRPDESGVGKAMNISVAKPNAARQSAREKQSSYMADDVVVIHHYPTKSAATQQKASIKHFSDIE